MKESTLTETDRDEKTVPHSRPPFSEQGIIKTYFRITVQRRVHLFYIVARTEPICATVTAAVEEADQFVRKKKGNEWSSFKSSSGSSTIG